MRIWTGRAGSGKTTAILREIAALHEGKTAVDERAWAWAARHCL